jgi:hypothetical protein
LNNVRTLRATSPVPDDQTRPSSAPGREKQQDGTIRTRAPGFPSGGTSYYFRTSSSEPTTPSLLWSNLWSTARACGSSGGNLSSMECGCGRLAAKRQRHISCHILVSGSVTEAHRHHESIPAYSSLWTQISTVSIVSTIFRMSVRKSSPRLHFRPLSHCWPAA